jgi:hypothetical protein
MDKVTEGTSTENKQKKRVLRCKNNLRLMKEKYEEMRKPQQQTSDPIHELV